MVYEIAGCYLMATAAAATAAKKSSILSLTINKRQYALREGDFDPKMFGAGVVVLTMWGLNLDSPYQHLFPLPKQDLVRISTVTWPNWNETR